jgi:predicted RNA-binding protein with PUA-like domain
VTRDRIKSFRTLNPESRQAQQNRVVPMKSPQKHWIVKQEPTAYPWEQFVRDGRTAWTGVRNFQARNYLRAMRQGDAVLYYHSVVGKEIVGEATVVREAYPDPTATEGEWICVDLAPNRALPKAVSLAALKDHPVLRNIGLIRQSRLSVIPLQPEEYQLIVRIGA